MADLTADDIRTLSETILDFARQLRAMTERAEAAEAKDAAARAQREKDRHEIFWQMDRADRMEAKVLAVRALADEFRRGHVSGRVSERISAALDDAADRAVIIGAVLSRLLTEAQAEAWDEGFSKAWYEALPYEDQRDASESKTPNPYREAGAS